MTNWVRAANPFWLMTDLTGGILDDSYYMFVLQNDLPYQPATIYQDPAMSVAWSNPIQFDADGTLPNNMYWDDEVVYRLEIRAGATQSDPLARPVVENFRPSDVSGGTDGDTSINADNQITNPQFAFVWFNSSITGTSVTNPTISLGEGWDLVLTGTGTYILTQDLLNPTDDEPNNSSYALNMNLTGFSAAVLRQRFSNMGMLWGGKFLATQLTAKQASGTTSTIAANLVPSTGSTVPLFSESMTSAYNVFSGTVEVPVSTNTDFPPDGYVELQIVLPPVGDTTVTSVQVVPTDANIDLTYSQDTYERQEDHTWHNYKDSVIIQAKDSILTGWDFGLNPWQFRSTVVAATGGAGVYTADQTIVVSENANMLKVGRNESGDLGAFKIIPDSGTQGKFALVQYIDRETIRPYFQFVLSALARAVIGSPLSTTIKFKMDILQSSTAPTAVNPIVSFGSPNTYTAQWTPIKSALDNEYTLMTDFADMNYSYDQFVLNSAVSLTGDYVAIVWYVSEGALQAGDIIAIDEISLAPNDFAIASNPKTFDQTLQECQFYWESSYNIPTFSGAGLDGAEMHYQHTHAEITGSTFTDCVASGHSFKFNTVKRGIPAIAYYAGNTGTLANVSAGIKQGAGYLVNLADQPVATFWDETVSPKGVTLNQNNSTPIAISGTGDASAAGVIIYNWTADARLGI